MSEQKPQDRAIIAECWTCLTIWHHGNPMRKGDPCKDSPQLHPHRNNSGKPQTLTARGAEHHIAIGHDVRPVEPQD